MASTAATIPHARLDGRVADGTLRAIAEPSASAVSWGAIFAGAATAAILSLILVMLGMGLGLSSVSPWSADGISATSFGVSTIVWLTLTQLLASAMGGYIAGRLRTRWIEVHSDEVYFRDTAHGFLAWAVASLVTASLLTSTLGSILGGGLQAGAAVAGGVANAAASGATAAGGSAVGSDGGALNYFVDGLFRPGPSVSDSASTVAMMPAANTDGQAARTVSEVSRIFTHATRSEPLPAEDVRYVGQIVAQRTGLSQQDSERRVTETYDRVQTSMLEAETKAKNALETSRKATAYGSLWLFVSLLIGAFVASFTATVGGRLRDD